MIESLNVFVDDNFIEYRREEDDELIYKVDKNSIMEDTGCTMQNIAFPIPGYYINLRETFGETLECGNIVNNFFSMIKGSIENVVLIIDFEGIRGVSTGFCQYFTKYLLTSNNKVIYINQNIDVSNTFGQFIYANTEIE